MASGGGGAAMGDRITAPFATAEPAAPPFLRSRIRSRKAARREQAPETDGPEFATGAVTGEAQIVEREG